MPGRGEKESIRIKIPPQSKGGSPSQHVEPPTTSRGKSVNKRRLIVDSDDDGDPDPLNITTVSNSPVSMRRIPPFKRSRTSEPTSDISVRRTETTVDPSLLPESDTKASTPSSARSKADAPVAKKLSRGGPAPDKASAATAKRPRLKETHNDEESITIDVVNNYVGPTVVSTPPPVTVPPPELELAKDKESTPPPPKKRKLPTIRKNKNTTGPAGPVQPASVSDPSKVPLNTSTGVGVGGGVGAGKTIGGTDDSLALPQSVPVVRKPAALVGSADFDLRKPSVYAELFKPTGANTPRSGLNRREKDEERRKELNRMRDEAKAKRNLDAKCFFDLQGQWDKISRFEERLRHEKSSVLFPNILAAKVKDEWEKERRRQGREIARGEVIHADGKAKTEIDREEGELGR